MSCNAKKDPNGTWRIQYRWTDWTGTKKKSQKRGFKTKKEAEEWLADFLSRQASDPSMTLSNFWEIYKEDMSITFKFCTFFTPKKCTDITDVSLRVNHLFPLSDNFHQLSLQP